MARPYKHEEDKVIFENIDSILLARECKKELEKAKLEYIEIVEQLERQIAKSEKMLVQLNGRLEMTIQVIKTQNNNCIINNYYGKEGEDGKEVHDKKSSSETSNS